MAAKTSNELAEYEKAISNFGSGVQLIQAGNYAKAKDIFKEVLGAVKDEPVLAERSRMYVTVCEKRLAPIIEPGSTADDLYYRAVMECNDGNTSEAITLLDQALQQTPNSARLLYARASAWAISGRADAAVSDLRQAIALDPTLRFQAVNDFDFERIREEPSFIDIIEPTSAGV